MEGGKEEESVLIKKSFNTLSYIFLNGIHKCNTDISSNTTADLHTPLINNAKMWESFQTFFTRRLEKREEKVQ